jgi:hypothetical protein
MPGIEVCDYVAFMDLLGGEIPERHGLKRLFTANSTLLFRSLLALLCLGLVCCHGSGQPHWVTLAWEEAPAPAPASAVAGYNAYRGTTSGPYAKIASGVPRPFSKTGL